MSLVCFIRERLQTMPLHQIIISRKNFFIPPKKLAAHLEQNFNNFDLMNFIYLQLNQNHKKTGTPKKS